MLKIIYLLLEIKVKKFYHNQYINYEEKKNKVNKKVKRNNKFTGSKIVSVSLIASLLLSGLIFSSNLKSKEKSIDVKEYQPDDDARIVEVINDTPIEKILEEDVKYEQPIIENIIENKNQFFLDYEDRSRTDKAEKNVRINAVQKGKEAHDVEYTPKR